MVAVVDMHSFRVDGYFEETKLRGIDIGQPVDIIVMGEPKPLRGHVQSIVAGIEDRDRTQSANLLPNVNPAFSWVRLAQRIPVRVALDEVPADFRLIAGRTATVSVRDLSPVRTRAVSGTGGASGSVAASAAPVAPGSSVGSGSAGATATAPSGASQ
ncbi:multidrug resistance efflux pump [Paraburkholderia youngii]